MDSLIAFYSFGMYCVFFLSETFVAHKQASGEDISLHTS